MLCRINGDIVVVGSAVDVVVDIADGTVGHYTVDATGVITLADTPQLAPTLFVGSIRLVGAGGSSGQGSC